MNLQLFALKDFMIAMTDSGTGGGTKKEEKKNTTTYDPNSIVDYLKQQGQDSSYSARKELAKELGITNYKGSGEQNTQMLNMLKSGSTNTSAGTVGSAGALGAVAGALGAVTPKTETKVETPKTETPKTETPTIVAPKVETPVAGSPKIEEIKTNTNISGVDDATYGTMNFTFTASNNVTNAQNVASSARDTVTSMSAPTISKETWNTINTPFSVSSAYTEAMNYTNALLEKLSSGRTSYTDQIKDMMNQIQNRDKFSYDVENDTLFQQALASAMGSGKQAMQDTMGQASALTGGYASTYAQSAGNQAYNAYIEDAYNNLPEYYQMAMDAYQMEGQEMYNQLSMLNDADATEYGRMYDSWNANFANAQQMYNQEYGAWQDSVNNAFNSANLQLNQQSMAYDQAYNNYQALQSNAETLYAQEYQKWSDMVNNAFNVAGMQNSDYWNQKDNDYKYDVLEQDDKWNQKDLDYRYDALEQDDKWNQKDLDYKYDALEQDDKWNAIDNTYRYDVMENNNEQNALDREQDDEWNQKDLDYKYSALDQDDAQFTARYDLNGDGKVDAKDQILEEEDEGVSYKEPTESQKQKALKAYNEGGEEAYYQYIDSLPSDIDVDAIDLYVNGDGAGSNGYGTLPLEQRTFTKTKDTVNGLWGVDNNDIVQDQYGNTYRVDELPESLRKALTKLKQGESYTAK